MDASFRICRLRSPDVPLVRALNQVFGEAFAEVENYSELPPSDAYLSDLLAKEHIVVLVALSAERVVGGLAAYELDKFERQRREMYLYDLAVAMGYRRRGIATALIKRLQQIAAQRAASVVYVQADYGDDAAIALYQKLGVREDVMHFDLPVTFNNQIVPP
ncbi:MAG: AAC(3)-I family aminoglycoside N-acetyltransferase [Steroidobacteraceae bacterium]